MLKKLFILSIFSIIILLYACSSADFDEADENNIELGAMNGPTMIGLGKLYKDNELNETKNKYTITKESTADGITAGLLNKKYDAAAVPANVASILFNKSGLDIQVAAINTLNVLYLVENGMSINSIADLKGKKIYAPGQGTTPEYILRYLLEENGIDPDKDIEIEYRTEGSEIVSELKAGKISLALLPQPAATSAIMGSSTINIRLNINDEWKKIAGNQDNEIITGVLVVRTAYLKNNQATFDQFLEEYKTSVDFMTKPENLDQAAHIVVDLQIVLALPVAKASLPMCNITFITGQTMKEQMNNFLTILYNQNREAIGGKIPNEKFYYSKKTT